MNNPLSVGAFMIIAAVISIILINYFINKLYFKKIENENTPRNSSLLKTSMIISFVIIFSSIKTPFNQLLNVLNSLNNGNQINTKIISFFTLFLFIVFLVYMINFLLSTFLFKIILNGEELSNSLKNDKIYNIILFGTLMICLSFISQLIIPDIIDLMIPYPQTPMFR